MSRSPIVAGIVAAVFIGAPQFAAGQQPIPSTPLFRAGVQLNLLDVVVRDRTTGALVTGLTKDDFEIQDNRRRRPVASFAAVDLPAAVRPASMRSGRAATNEGREGRIIAFFVNDATLDFFTTPYLRDLLHRFVDHHMTDGDQVAILTTSNAVPSQGFTTDRARLDRIIDSLQGTIDLGQGPAWETWYGFGALVRALAPFSHERKIVVYLGSWAGPPFPIFAADIDEYNRVLGEAAAANVAVYPISVRGVTGRISLPLNVLAEETGGVVAHRNDFDHVLERVEEDAGSYYLLGFTAGARDAAPGKLHQLRVTVDRRDVVVLARTKYMPFPPAAPFGLSPLAVPVQDLALAPLQRRDLPLRARASCFGAAGGRVTVLLTVRPDEAGMRFAGHTLEYAADAIDAQGRIVDSASGATPVPAGTSMPTIAIVSTLHVRAGFATIQAAVRTDDGLEGSVFVDVDVPKRTARLSMSDIEVTSASAHELVLGNPPEFLRRHLPTPPVVDRTFAPGDRVTLYGEVYASRRPARVSGVVTVRAEDGRVERTVPLPLLAEVRSSNRRRFGYVIPLDLNGLSPGTHLIEVAASDRDGRHVQKQVRLRVASAAAAPTSNR